LHLINIEDLHNKIIELLLLREEYIPFNFAALALLEEMFKIDKRPQTHNQKTINHKPPSIPPKQKEF